MTTATMTKHRVRPLEVRFSPHPNLQVRTDTATGVLAVQGYGYVSETPYSFAGAKEVVRRGASTKTLSENPEVVLKAEHSGLPLAKTTVPAGQPGSLTLSEDDHGLFFRALMDAEDSDAQLLAGKIRNGLMTGASFAFRVIRESQSPDGEIRYLDEISLAHGDVSVCTWGANPAAYAALARKRQEDADEGRRLLDTYRARALALKLNGRAHSKGRP